MNALPSRPKPPKGTKKGRIPANVSSREQIQREWADHKVARRADRVKLQQMVKSIQNGRRLFEESCVEALSAMDCISESTSKSQCLS